MKKVLGIVGSPRKNGSTDRLIDLVLDGAGENGAQTEKISLYNMKIEDCRECLCCHNGAGQCVIRDDMEKLAKKMNEADVWVLGTPIFWWGPTGRFKTFMDRWYGYRFNFKEKKIILVYPSGTVEDSVASYLCGMMNDSLEYEGTKLFAGIHAGGVDTPEDLKKYPEIVHKARKAGADSVL